MKESSFYQMILEEGRAEGVAQGVARGARSREARRILLRLGGSGSGPPDPATVEAIEAIGRGRADRGADRPGLPRRRELGGSPGHRPRMGSEVRRSRPGLRPAAGISGHLAGEGRGGGGRGRRLRRRGLGASAWAAGASPSSFLTARTSILRTHSRVTPRRRPTSLRVIGVVAVEAEAERDDGPLAVVEPVEPAEQLRGARRRPRARRRGPRGRRRPRRATSRSRRRPLRAGAGWPAGPARPGPAGRRSGRGSRRPGRSVGAWPSSRVRARSALPPLREQRRPCGPAGGSWPWCWSGRGGSPA